MILLLHLCTDSGTCMWLSSATERPNLYDYGLYTNASPKGSTNFRDTSCTFVTGERKRRMLTAQCRVKRETEIRYIRKHVEIKIVLKKHCGFWKEDREMKAQFYPRCHNKRGEACSLKFLLLSFISSIFGSVLPSELSLLYFNSCNSFRAMFCNL
jgi:hypothetical protein